MQTVLLVEDSKEVFTMVKQAIGSIVDLHWVESIDTARDKLNEDLSLILLDIELPDGSGVDFCTEVQASFPDLPIFFLTSHDDLSDKVLGFSAGADDYITKPFQPLELKARVESRLKKEATRKQSTELLKWVEIEIDKNCQEVKILNEGVYEKIDLTALEFKLLTYFAGQEGHVIPRDKVLDDIWGKDVHIYSRSVDTHVSKLRKKLGPVSHIIQSVHGAGYKFSPS
ncbi:MAG: hypothetical protein CL677_02840 [Bdellovibrionaceae bacterium]|nr:hypothetical protein [Pseudobdellovibrionaceae bacterium]|tara:strand:- start:28776 stop:29456 length:681 start_codon:yes stop_codon:yes gene_type:complete